MKAAMTVLATGVALTIPLLATTAETDSIRANVERGKITQLQARQATAPTTQQLPVYIPPLRGAPVSRVGGASRGSGDASVTVEVLAPDHTGLTVSPRPTLYWYLSALSAAPLDFTLIDEAGIKPLVEVRLDAPESPGVQRVDLAELDVTLKPGVNYQWFVALIPDPKQRSNDILAGGMIKRITPSQALMAKLKRASQGELPHIYAEEGIWYDALAAVSEPMRVNPDDATLRTARAALLEQVGLNDVAAEDVSFASYEFTNSGADGAGK